MAWFHCNIEHVWFFRVMRNVLNVEAWNVIANAAPSNIYKSRPRAHVKYCWKYTYSSYEAKYNS